MAVNMNHEARDAATQAQALIDTVQDTAAGAASTAPADGAPRTGDHSDALNTAREAVSTAAQALGTEALCDAIGGNVSPKDVRRWLRAATREALGRAGAAEILPGRGGAYAFTAEQVESLARAYRTRTGAAPKRAGAPASVILDALAAREVAVKIDGA